MKTRASRLLTMLLTLALVLQTTALPVTAAGKTPAIETVLNNAPLHPTSTGSYTVDEYIATTLARITTPQMSTHQKVKAIYDFLIAELHYMTQEDAERDIRLPLDVYQDADGAGFGGYLAMRLGAADCMGYSSVFSMFARYIGLNSYVVKGGTHRASGGMTRHWWSVINVGGTEYIFDAQIEDNIAKGGPVRYYRFGKTYAELPVKYQRDSIDEILCCSPLTGYEPAPKVAIPYQTTAASAKNKAATAGNTGAFDAAFYGALYPDVVRVFGTSPEALYSHYVQYGKREGRFPTPQAFLEKHR